VPTFSAKSLATFLQIPPSALLWACEFSLSPDQRFNDRADALDPSSFEHVRRGLGEPESTPLQLELRSRRSNRFRPRSISIGAWDMSGFYRELATLIIGLRKREELLNIR
jgi:hypothetical protein